MQTRRIGRSRAAPGPGCSPSAPAATGERRNEEMRASEGIRGSKVKNLATGHGEVELGGAVLGDNFCNDLRDVNAVSEPALC